MPPATQGQKIIQLVAYKNVLIALTDTNEIWFLHGLEAIHSGTDGMPPRQWRPLSALIPAPVVLMAAGSDVPTPAGVSW